MSSNQSFSVLITSCTMNKLQLDLQLLVRPNILNLTPYRCARDDYSEGNCCKLDIYCDADLHNISSALNVFFGKNMVISLLHTRKVIII